MYVFVKESCYRYIFYICLFLNSFDCLVEFLLEKSLIFYYVIFVLMKLDGVCFFCIYWNILVLWFISLFVEDLYFYLI